MRPRQSAALLSLSVLALLALAAPAAHSSTSLSGAVQQSAGATAAPSRGTAAQALKALERRQQQLTASDSTFDQSFGLSIAISGDAAVLGAPGHDVGANAAQGAVYVFMRAGATWTQR